MLHARHAVSALCLVLAALPVACTEDSEPSESTSDALGSTPTIFGSRVPANKVERSDTQPVELGVKFRSAAPGKVTSIRFYRGARSRSGYTASLWSASGTRLATAAIASDTYGSGWRQIELASPVAIDADTTYIASYYAPGGKYAYEEGGLSTAATAGPLTALASSEAGGNGVYAYGQGGGFPRSTYRATNYFVDVTFELTTAAPPAPTDTSTPPPPPAPPPVASTSVELPGPSAALLDSHPYYACTNNRYVATAQNGGSDSNDGLAPTVGGGHGPWLTLQHANDALPQSGAGYCVNVGEGTYSMSRPVRIDRGGNTASTTGFVVWRSTSLNGAKLVSTSANSNIFNVAVPYVIVDGFEMNGGHYASSGAGIDTCFNGTSYNGIHHVVALNNYIHDMGASGVAACWGEYYWFIHNRLDRNAYNSWNSGASIYEPMAIPNYTPTAYDKQWTPYHNVIAHNRCYGNFTSPNGGPHTDGNGIIYDDTRHEQNTPHVVYTPKALIMGNVAWRNGGFGIQVGPTSANADVFNNTAYDNGLDTKNTGTWRGEFSSAFGDGITFKNNIGYAVVGSGILSNNAPFRGNQPAAATNAWSSNIAFGARPAMDAPDSFPVPANKVETDPRFVNLDAANFALQGDSPAIGFGAQVPYWPQQTPGAIDVGACPSGVSACP